MKYGNTWASVLLAAVVMLTGLLFETAECRPGGMMGGSGMGGGGMQGRMQDMCSKSPQLCDEMDKVKEYCEKQSGYCEMAGLPVMKDRSSQGGPPQGGGPGGSGPGGGSGGSRPEGGPGGPGGDAGDSDMRSMMRKCMEEGSGCDEAVAYLKGQLEYAKQIQGLCEGEGGDTVACGLMKDTVSFCNEEKEICGNQRAMRSDSGNSDNAAPGPSGQFKSMVEACAGGTEECGTLKTETATRLEAMRYVKESCVETGAECDAAKAMLKACSSGEGDCAKMLEMKTLCQEDPEECARLKQEALNQEIDEMKKRCIKNIEVCKRNTEIRRKNCDAKPDECSPQMMEQIRAMEEVIEQNE